MSGSVAAILRAIAEPPLSTIPKDPFMMSLLEPMLISELAHGPTTCCWKLLELEMKNFTNFLSPHKVCPFKFNFDPATFKVGDPVSYLASERYGDMPFVGTLVSVESGPRHHFFE